MKLKLKYRDNSYFNAEDIFVFLDSACKKVFSSKVHLHNGNWHTNESLNFKCTSIKSDKLWQSVM